MWPHLFSCNRPIYTVDMTHNLNYELWVLWVECGEKWFCSKHEMPEITQVGIPLEEGSILLKCKCQTPAHREHLPPNGRYISNDIRLWLVRFENWVSWVKHCVTHLVFSETGLSHSLPPVLGMKIITYTYPVISKMQGKVFHLVVCQGVAPLIYHWPAECQGRTWWNTF